MKTIRRIAVLVFCTGLLLSATSCAVAVPTEGEGYHNERHHRFYERRHERHERHKGDYDDRDRDHEH